MKQQRKIIVYIATSADGYIARADGSVDWLNRPRTADNYGMSDFYKSIDTILWGRKTYDPVLQKFSSKKSKAKRSSPKTSKTKSPGSHMKNYVFSRRPPETSPPEVEFVNAPIKEFTKLLRSQPGKNIWMMGGAGIIGSFLDEGEIDEFMIHVVPMFIGEGIPLVQPRHRTVPLQLLTTQAYSDGVVRLHYAVAR